MKGVWGGALGYFCYFSVKITHFYTHFGQNSYFKAITHQIKAFKISLNVLNRINKVQILQYSYKSRGYATDPYPISNKL